MDSIRLRVAIEPERYACDRAAGNDLAGLPVDPRRSLNCRQHFSLIGNMPIPAADGDFVQISRDVLTAIWDEAEHLAQSKESGKRVPRFYRAAQKVY